MAILLDCNSGVRTTEWILESEWVAVKLSRSKAVKWIAYSIE